MKRTTASLHYNADGSEFSPPSGDILNPEATASFIHLVHDRYYDALKDHFGKTIWGIFTDEPNPLGRGGLKDVRPWTWGFADFLQRRLGYDFRPHVALLAAAGRKDLATWMARDYLEAYARGLNGYIQDLRHITLTSRETPLAVRGQAHG